MPATAYEVEMEVAGPLAMFARPDTGGTPTSYPVPTWSAAKGLFESIAFFADAKAWICPVRVDVCRRVGEIGGRIRFQRYTNNYGGPLRKPDLFKKGALSGGSSMQLVATVLSDVCYRLHGREAGVSMAERHPDIKDVAHIPTLLVRLDLHGQVASVAPVPQEAKPWTLRDGQQNSFPFVQLRSPLCPVADADGRRNIALDRKSGNAARRAALLGLLTDRRIDAGALHGWPGDGLCSRLRERRQELASLEGTEAATVLQTLDRFLLASADSEALLRSIVEKLSEGLSKSPQESWLEIAVALLLGKFDKKSSEWRSAGALLFDTADGQLPIHHSSTAAQVSQALRHGLDSDQAAQETGTCGLTGARGRLLSGNFPQPNLPVLGQTYIFAKNKETPANDRYGRFSAAAMPVGQDTAIRLAAGIEALTKSEREGITWRRIPGEAPKQKDLLVAFVESSVDAPAVRTFVDDDAEEDFSEETSRASRDEDSVAGFEKRTQRVIEAVRAKVG